MPTDYSLYVLAIPEASRSQTGTTARQNITELGILRNDLAAAEMLSTNPNQQTLNGYYAGQYAEKMATELKELGQGTTAAAPAPLTGQQSSTPLDGYYLIESADVKPPSAKERSFWRYQLSLTKEGTRASHRRATETDLSQVDHPFGNDQTAHVGVPAAASKVRWHNPKTHALAEPTLVGTRSAELGDVEIYNATSAPFDNPTLVYKIDYVDEGFVDVRVFDERGVGTKLDDSGVLQWQKCFVSSHDFEGVAVVDNGLARLRFDEDAPELTAQRWDADAEQWVDQTLGESDWSLHDFDLREVGLASVHARVEFQNAGEYHVLDCWVKRGWENPLWGETGEPVPAGLETLLEPVASASNYEPGESKALVDRGDL